MSRRRLMIRVSVYFVSGISLTMLIAWFGWPIERNIRQMFGTDLAHSHRYIDDRRPGRVLIRTRTLTRTWVSELMLSQHLPDTWEEPNRRRIPSWVGQNSDIMTPYVGAGWPMVCVSGRISHHIRPLELAETPAQHSPQQASSGTMLFGEFIPLRPHWLGLIVNSFVAAMFTALTIETLGLAWCVRRRRRAKCDRRPALPPSASGQSE